MAKGARKKTKWVSLPLGSAAATTTSTSTAAATIAGRFVDSSKSSWSSKLRPEAQRHLSDSDNDAAGSYRNTTENNSQQYQTPNEHHGVHHQRSYSSSSRSHHHPSNSYRHHSTSVRKPYYSTYRSTANTSEAKNEQNGCVTVNEDEYTKITTPRQDVLFKKGYLSRPKRNTPSTLAGSDAGLTAASGSTAGTTTDGSDGGATGSGSVSTAESITSDSTYLTDGLLMELPAPYPYFGYFDQSGVLVMNGFAVDNNGYSYMNGGQTYIYPPNYGCQPSQEEDGQSLQAAAALEEVSPTSEGNLPDTTDTPQVAPGVPSSDDDVLEGKNEPKQYESLEGNQLEEQQILSPYFNGYDYAQFYNTFYYPGCVMAPFPVVDNGGFYEQADISRDSEQPRDGRRHRRWYPHWDENYLESGVVCANLPEETMTASQVPVDAASFEANSNPAETTSPNSVHPVLSSHSPKTNSGEMALHSRSFKSSADQKTEVRSHSSNGAKQQQKSQSLKTHKRDLIQATLAFAEQNIDLSKPAYRSGTRRPESENTWRVVCNGKEITIEGDNEARPDDTKHEIAKMEAIVELPEAATSDEAAIVANDANRNDCKPIKKETQAKKGKKTAKGKGKKSKRPNLAHQHKGFELIEPEFTETVEKVLPTDSTLAKETDDEEILLETTSSNTAIEADHSDSGLLNTNKLNNFAEEAEEDLEQMLHDVEVADLLLEVEYGNLEKRIGEVVIDSAVEIHQTQAIEQEDNIEESTQSDDSLCNVYPGLEACDTPLVERPEITSHEKPPSRVSSIYGDMDKDDDVDSRHFSGEEYGENFDSGLQSPAALVTPASDEKDHPSFLDSYSGSGLHVTDAVTKWLSDTLCNVRPEEMFVLPQSPELLDRILQFRLANFEDSLALSSDTYSSSSSSSEDEAEDADSDYMSDVQVKKRQSGEAAPDNAPQKTESQKDQLAKQTANGYHRTSGGSHSNPKQKRCIIM